MSSITTCPAPPHRPFVAAVSVIGLCLLAVIAVTRAAGVLEHADALFALFALAILIAELFPVDLPDDRGAGLVLDELRLRAPAH